MSQQPRSPAERARRTRQLVWAHVGLVALIVAGYVWAQLHR